MQKSVLWSPLLVALTVCGCGGELRDSDLSSSDESDPSLVTTDGASPGGNAAVSSNAVPASGPLGSTEETTQPLSCAPRRTTAIRIAGNLDSTSVTLTLPWDPMDAVRTSNFSTTLTLYDDAETPTLCDVYFRIEARDVWSYHVLFNYDTAPVVLGSGYLYYASNGTLSRRVDFAPVQFPDTSSSAGRLITIYFGSFNATGEGDWEGLSQRPMPCSISEQWQDGHVELTGEYCRE